jgi:Zn-dependent alcohol dehydrogenase
MKSAILVELNKPLLVTGVELCELLVGQVLVRVLVSGICGSQLHEISGNKGNGRFLPHLMGHEGCGIVEKIGPGVSTVKPGDKVVMHWRQGSGIDSEFPKYLYQGKEFSSGKVNTLTEKAIVSENRLTSVPAETDSEFAALLGCSLSTAFGIIDYQSNLLLGESVAILGCGGVGLSLILAAKLKGASSITVVDRSQSKKSIAQQHGATDFRTAISDIPRKIDLVIDTTGSSELIASAFSCLSNSGRIIMVGQPEPGQELRIPNALSFFSGEGLQLRATQGGGGFPNVDIPRYLNLFNSLEMNVKSLVTHRYELAQINEAFKTLISGEAGRIMITMESDC